ncbi:MAG: hypothetical protein U0527_07520 [Candidatus Eisenbacteria bacterium]
MMRDRLGAHPVPIQVPYMLGDVFHSLIDLVEMVEIQLRRGARAAEVQYRPDPST